MSNYIEILNNSGKTIVNSTWHNLSLSRKFTFSGNVAYDVALSPHEILAIQISSNNMWAYVERDKSGASIVMDGNPQKSEVRNPASTLTCTAYVFGENKGSSNCGLEIYNDSGEQIFSSALKYMKPIDCINLNQGDKKQYSVPIAIACGAPWTEDYNGDVFDHLGYVMENTSTVKCIDLGGTVDDEDMKYPAGSFGNCSILVIDVTNF